MSGFQERHGGVLWKVFPSQSLLANSSKSRLRVCSFFQKATAHPTRGALVAARTRRNISCGVFFFAKLFSLRLYCQRKKRVSNLKRLCVERGTPHLCGSPSFRRWRKFTPSVALSNDKGVSPSAEGDRRSRRLRRAFEKARAKLSTRHRRGVLLAL